MLGRFFVVSRVLFVVSMEEEVELCMGVMELNAHFQFFVG